MPNEGEFVMVGHKVWQIQTGPASQEGKTLAEAVADLARLCAAQQREIDELKRKVSATPRAG